MDTDLSSATDTAPALPRRDAESSQRAPDPDKTPNQRTRCPFFYRLARLQSQLAHHLCS
jgi:hypothetical protein